MGRRDYQHKETKKQKKDPKKVSATILPLATEVEVIKKPRKKREEEPEE
jgi:hypothetical protein